MRNKEEGKKSVCLCRSHNLLLLTMRTELPSRFVATYKRHCLPAGNGVSLYRSCVLSRTITLFSMQFISTVIMFPKSGSVGQKKIASEITRKQITERRH